MTMDALDRLDSYETFSAEYKSYKGSFGKLDSNCPLPSRSISAALERGPVYFHRYTQGIAVFADEGGHLVLYFFFDPGRPFPEIVCAKDVLVEIPVTQRDLDGPFARQRDRLTAAGFELVSDNLQVSTDLTLRADEIHASLRSSEAAIAAHGLTYSCDVTPAMAEEIKNLWREYLKPTDVPREHLNFADDASQNVVCVLDEKGHVAGVHWWKVSGASCELRHTVTHPDHYRKGVGSYMICFSLASALSAGCRSAYTFIDAENSRSLRMYDKLGLAPNGRRSFQFIKKNPK